MGGLTRVVAVLLALEMIGTTLLVKVDVGLVAQGGTGAEIDLALLAASSAWRSWVPACSPSTAPSGSKPGSRPAPAAGSQFLPADAGRYP